MGAAKVSTDAVSDLLGAEQSSGLDNGALAMHPLGLDRVEPRTLDRQEARHDAHALPTLLDLPIVGTNPGPHPLAHVPGGIVPDQQPHADARLLQPGAAPRQELLGDGADRTAIDEAQPDALCSPDLAQQHAVAGQGFGIGIVLGRLSCSIRRSGPSIGVRPGVQVRPGEATPPRLIGKAQRPVRMLLATAIRRSRRPFFGHIAGSGLVIQCLARSQPMPRRSSVWRMVSPLTRVGTMPSATLTSAAQVQRPQAAGFAEVAGAAMQERAQALGLLRGEDQARAVGARGLLLQAGEPEALKACRASSTVWSSQPRCSAMRGARSPRALANRI